MKKYSLIILIILLPVIGIVANTGATESTGLDKVKQSYYRNRLKEDSLPPVVKVSFIDSVYAVSPYNKTKHLQDKGSIYFRAGLYREALDLYAELAKGKDSLPESDYMDAIWHLAYSQNAIGKYEDALHNIYLMITTPKSDSLDYYDVEADFMLGYLYELMGNKSKRAEYLEAAKKKIDNLQCDLPHQQNLRYRYHLEKASMYIEAQDWNNAFSEDSIAMTYAMDPESMLMVDFDMALLYDQAGYPDQAEEHFKKYISDASTSINRVYALHNYALFLLRQNRLNEAKDLCLNQIKYTEINGIDHVKGSLWDILSQIYDKEGNYREAYRALKRSTEILDSLFEWKNNSSITEVTKKFEDDLKLFENERLARENRNKNIVIVCSLSLIVLIGAISFVLFRKWHQRKSHAIELATELSRQQNQNRETEQNLKEELETNNREMLALNMQLTESDNLIGELKEITSDIHTSGSEMLREIRGKLQSGNLSKGNWEVFKSYFDKIHPNFFTILFDKHPDLTPGEMRMCAYILLNLSAKEIASLTSRSQRTIESMKYRLHKKLGLGADCSTLSYLHLIKAEYLLRQQSNKV